MESRVYTFLRHPWSVVTKINKTNTKQITFCRYKEVDGAKVNIERVPDIARMPEKFKIFQGSALSDPPTPSLHFPCNTTAGRAR